MLETHNINVVVATVSRKGKQGRKQKRYTFQGSSTNDARHDLYIGSVSSANIYKNYYHAGFLQVWC